MAKCQKSYEVKAAEGAANTLTGMVNFVNNKILLIIYFLELLMGCSIICVWYGPIFRGTWFHVMLSVVYMIASIQILIEGMVVMGAGPRLPVVVSPILVRATVGVVFER